MKNEEKTGNRYVFTEKVWIYPGEAAVWHFVTLPKTLAREIRERSAGVRRGFGSLPVEVTIGATTWRTSIFPDKREDSYLLPLKADVRRREGIRDRDTVKVAITLRPSGR